MSVNISSVLLKTRLNILDVCDDLKINFETIDLTKLGVAQCISCDIWETHKNCVTGEDGITTCLFCDDDSNFKI